jgi:hypothetical protein
VLDIARRSDFHAYWIDESSGNREQRLEATTLALPGDIAI